MYCLGQYVLNCLVKITKFRAVTPIMEGRICFEYRWGLKPVLVYSFVIQGPFSISITIINGLIHRTICHQVSAAICIGRPVCLCSSAAICIAQSICNRYNMYWSTNMSFRIRSNMRWLHQYATEFNMIYNTCWNSYRLTTILSSPTSNASWLKNGWVGWTTAVSYTHLTLPTTSRV